MITGMIVAQDIQYLLLKRTTQSSSKYCVLWYYISQTHECVKWRVVSCHTELFGSTQSLELGNITRAIEIWAIYIHWTQ